MEEAAKKLTDKENGVYGFAAYNHDQEGWGNFLYENGGSIIDETTHQSGLDKPESIEAMEWYMNMNANYSPSNEMMAEVNYIELFATGTVAMQTFGNWELSYFTENELVKDKFAITELPAGPTGIKATQITAWRCLFPATAGIWKQPRSLSLMQAPNRGCQIPLTDRPFRHLRG